MTATDRDILRIDILTPYRRGMGPTFRITTWDTHRTNNLGKCILGYELAMTSDHSHHQSQHPMDDVFDAILFTGEDFGCSPLHCTDSDNAVATLMGYLALRPGNTDAEYFANYTAEQLAYCDEHAETLSCYIANRFGDR